MTLGFVTLELSTAATYELISTDVKSVVNKHCNDIDTRFAVGITESQEKLPTFYWLPKLHKRPYKACFIAKSSSCTTTSLSKVLTSCLTAIKNHWIKYCEKLTKIYDKRDAFNFDIVNFPFLDGDVPRRPSYGVYIYLNLFASHVTDFNNCNKFLTANFLSKTIGIINSAKRFPNFIVGTLN